MNEQEQSQGKTGEFFSVNLTQIDTMVESHEAGADEVLAYLVMARGVNRRGDKQITAHGANSIATRTGMSHHRAKDAIAWLDAAGFSLKPTIPPVSGVVPSKLKLARRELAQALDSDDIYLANALVDGLGRGKGTPPLMRIYNEAKIGENGLMATARLDAVMLLLHLYRHHDLEGCGGIDPRAGIYREWTAAENSYGDKVTDIDGTNAALYEIQGNHSVMFKTFAAEALFYVANEDERSTRFWTAFSNLYRLGLLYEATQVWSANPHIGTPASDRAEPLYTLYIHDHHARAKDPYLQREIHTAALHHGAIDSVVEFTPLGIEDHEAWASSNIINSGRFRYIATKKYGGFPIGIYRLRYRPKTRDAGIGIEAERRRVATWVDSLKRTQAA